MDVDKVSIAMLEQAEAGAAEAPKDAKKAEDGERAVRHQGGHVSGPDRKGGEE